MRTALITPTYRNDLELAVDLCASIDHFAHGHTLHLLIVPRADLPLFRPLAGPRRELVTAEEVLGPFGLRRLPLPTRLHVPGLVNRRLREQWWHRSAGRVSGWVTQQIIKLAADRLTDAEVLVFADSDIVLFRPMDMACFVDGNSVVLHSGPMDMASEGHIAWLNTARRLLGLPGSEPVEEPIDHIGSLISWRRDVLRELHTHLRRRHGREWPAVIAAESRVAEYLLYGLFCREVLGLPAARHVARDNGLVHAIWTADAMASPEAFARGLRPSHVALQIQSTLPLPLPQRRRFLEDAQRAATTWAESGAAALAA